jgi:hypothetical protein
MPISRVRAADRESSRLAAEEQLLGETEDRQVGADPDGEGGDRDARETGCA